MNQGQNHVNDHSSNLAIFMFPKNSQDCYKKYDDHFLWDTIQRFGAFVEYIQTKPELMACRECNGI